LIELTSTFSISVGSTHAVHINIGLKQVCCC